MKSLIISLFAAIVLIGCGSGSPIDTGPGSNRSDTLPPAGPPCCECNLSPERTVVNRSGIPDELMEEYFLIWKSEFMSRNAMSEEYFNTHIRGIVTETGTWDGGISFSVGYSFVFDWLCIETGDRFLVNINPEYIAYRYIDLPRGQFLNDSQLRYVFSLDVGLGEVSTLERIDSLPFDSYDEALASFREQSGFPFIEIWRSEFKRFDRASLVKKPNFLGRGVIDRDANRCVKGNFNPATGQTFNVRESACYVD